MERRRFLAGIGAAASGGLAGCTGLLGDDDQDYDIGMTATAFRPAEITVGVGTEVVWMNTSTRAHTVTAYEELIPEEAEYFATGGYGDEATARAEWNDGGKGGIDNGETFGYTFEVAGEYDYVCIPHETGGMIGRVIVEE
ncbi:plastocyanin/azurin family copper-binding protein [Haloferacaceae archaeon DSL9]